jgi:hypothetical protein
MSNLKKIPDDIIKYCISPYLCEIINIFDLHFIDKYKYKIDNRSNTISFKDRQLTNKYILEMVQYIYKNGKHYSIALKKGIITILRCSILCILHKNISPKKDIISLGIKILKIMIHCEEIYKYSIFNKKVQKVLKLMKNTYFPSMLEFPAYIPEISLILSLLDMGIYPVDKQYGGGIHILRGIIDTYSDLNVKKVRNIINFIEYHKLEKYLSLRKRIKLSKGGEYSTHKISENIEKVELTLNLPINDLIHIKKSRKNDRHRVCLKLHDGPKIEWRDNGYIHPMEGQLNGHIFTEIIKKSPINEEILTMVAKKVADTFSYIKKCKTIKKNTYMKAWFRDIQNNKERGTKLGQLLSIYKKRNHIS